MKKLEPICEDGAKKLFSTDDPEFMIAEYKEEATGHLFRLFGKKGIPTCYAKMLITGECLLRKTESIPLQVRLWNLSADPLDKRIGLPQGTKLITPVLEHFWQKPDGEASLLNSCHILALGLAVDEELDLIKTYALRLNRLLQSGLADSDFLLTGFDFRFGRLPDGTIVLAQEFDAASLLFWNVALGKAVAPDSPEHMQAYRHLCENLLKDLL